MLFFVRFVEATHRKPNANVTYTDDHGCSDLSCQGAFDDIKAPNIDALETRGVRMTNGYCAAMCSLAGRTNQWSVPNEMGTGVEPAI